MTDGSGPVFLEKSELRLGIVALTDCAPIVVAVQKGFFARHGLRVSLSREASWSAIRDKLALGVLDGAQMLAGMPLASSLGVGVPPRAMLTACSLDLNGNAITVSEDLYQRMLALDPEAMACRPVSARALKRVIEQDRSAGHEPMVFATVFPVSSHNYELRYWMASAGIDPDRDVQLVVVPPSQMVAALQQRQIVGYCVGEPWNQRAVAIGIGRSLITSYEIWNNKPEKVFGVHREWAETHPNAHRAALRALIEAARWIDAPGNREEVVRIIAGKDYVDAPVEVVANSMTGTWRYSRHEAPVSMPDFNVYHRYAANFPWRSHAMWFLTQMMRWGQIEVPIDFRAVAEAVYRPDIYRAAAAELGIAAPEADYKDEGVHDAPWTLAASPQPIAMGPDRFFDGEVFSPRDPVGYLRRFSIHRMRVAPERLAELNPPT